MPSYINAPLVLVPEDRQPQQHLGLIALVSKPAPNAATAPQATQIAILYHLGLSQNDRSRELAGEDDTQPSLPPGLHTRLHQVLLRSGAFATQQGLKAIFANGWISTWRHRIPEATSETNRVIQCIDFLRQQFSADLGDGPRNALVLFVRVLRDLTPEGDQLHHELDALAKELAPVLRAPVPERGSRRLQYCWLIASTGEQGSFPEAQRIQRTLCDRHGVMTMIREVGDAFYSIQESYDLVRKIYEEEVPALGLSPADVIADFTGATKPMSGGMILACTQLGAPMQYMYGNRGRVASIPRLVDFAPADQVASGVGK